MNTRERLINIVHHRPVDRGLFWEEGLWPETRTRWFAEGYTEGDDFGFDRVDTEGRLDINIGYIPPWETGLVEDEGAHQLIRNKYGIIQRVSKTVRSDIAQYVSFPVSGREGWERLKNRLEPNAPNRFPDGWSDRFESLRRERVPITVGSGHLCGFFSFVRELVGDEEVMYLFYDDPDLVRQILDFQVHRLTTLLDRVLGEVQVDRMMIWEDMCYKNGPLISPALCVEFLLGPYRKTIDFAIERGVQVFDVDSDGNVLELLPLWIDVGVNMVYPFEVQAGMDVNEICRQFGDRLCIRGASTSESLLGDGLRSRVRSSAYDPPTRRVDTSPTPTTRSRPMFPLRTTGTISSEGLASSGGSTVASVEAVRSACIMTR